MPTNALPILSLPHICWEISCFISGILLTNQVFGTGQENYSTMMQTGGCGCRWIITIATRIGWCMKKWKSRLKCFGSLFMVYLIWHSGILNNPRKAHKINDCTAQWGAYYTTTTPFLKEPWNDNPQYKIDSEKRWLSGSFLLWKELPLFIRLCTLRNAHVR